MNHSKTHRGLTRSPYVYLTLPVRDCNATGSSFVSSRQPTPSAAFISSLPGLLTQGLLLEPIMASLASTSTLVDDWVDVEDSRALPARSKPTKSIECLDTQFYEHVNAIANDRLNLYTFPIFCTNLDPRQLYSHFHSALPTDMQREYNCNSCRGFVRRYGGLALVNDDGK